MTNACAWPGATSGRQRSQDAQQDPRRRHAAGGVQPGRQAGAQDRAERGALPGQPGQQVMRPPERLQPRGEGFGEAGRSPPSLRAVCSASAWTVASAFLARWLSSATTSRSRRSLSSSAASAARRRRASVSSAVASRSASGRPSAGTAGPSTSPWSAAAARPSSDTIGRVMPRATNWARPSPAARKVSPTASEVSAERTAGRVSSAKGIATATPQPISGRRLKAVSTGMPSAETPSRRPSRAPVAQARCRSAVTAWPTWPPPPGTRATRTPARSKTARIQPSATRSRRSSGSKASSVGLRRGSARRCHRGAAPARRRR